MVEDTPNMSDYALEQLRLILMAFTEMLPTVKYFVCVYSVSYFLYYGDSKYFPEDITPFTSGFQDITSIGENM